MSFFICHFQIPRLFFSGLIRCVTFTCFFELPLASVCLNKIRNDYCNVFVEEYNMDDDSELLRKQLDVNDERLRKLGEHKKSVESQLKNLSANEDHTFLLEIMKRLDHNLQIEYKQRDGIIKAINSKINF